MNLHGRGGRAVAAAMGTAIALTLGLSASPASAKASDGWVRGYDTFTDDFDDEGVLSKTSHTRSNATCLWQRILWAEGAKYRPSLEAPDRLFKSSQITGIFDDATYRATRALQARWDLGVDGEVGKASLGRAGTHLRKKSGSTARGKKLVLRYSGDAHTITIERNTEGKYLFKDRNNGWRQAGYDYRSCP
ncbi:MULTISPECIES: peptidoglycan-binding domain-containing protein [Streptomyces]|uniref:peptidoglycan-binding domain-containing protein n=1 Tax=Streptomyces TaxID=1883 RepID=UPI00211AFA54|nr:peptidoglycan-binding domain-containing protein [Streptomyces sp. WY228]